MEKVTKELIGEAGSCHSPVTEPVIGLQKREGEEGTVTVMSFS